MMEKLDVILSTSYRTKKKKKYFSFKCSEIQSLKIK